MPNVRKRLAKEIARKFAATIVAQAEICHWVVEHTDLTAEEITIAENELMVISSRISQTTLIDN